jgi:hypothetical protein
LEPKFDPETGRGSENGDSSIKTIRGIFSGNAHKTRKNSAFSRSSLEMLYILFFDVVGRRLLFQCDGGDKHTPVTAALRRGRRVTWKPLATPIVRACLPPVQMQATKRL